MKFMNNNINVCHFLNTLSMGGAEKSTIEIANYLNTSSENIHNFIIILNKKNFGNLRIGNVKYLVLESNNIFKNIYIILKFLNSNNINIIHSHFIKSTIICSLLKYIYRYKIKFVITEHSLVNLHKINPIKIFLYKIALINSDRVIAVSKLSLSYLQSNLNNQLSKICLVNNFINFNQFLLRKRNISNPIKINFLIVSRLASDKNLIEAINFCIFMSKYIKVHLDIVGDGEMKSQLLNFIYLNGNSNFSSNFHGNQIIIKEFLYKSDFLLNFSLKESFSLSTLESLATGLPVICFNSKFVELFDSYDSPMIYSDDNSFLDLRDNLFKYIKNKKKYNYRDYLKNKYDISVSSIKLLEVYVSLKGKF